MSWGLFTRKKEETPDPLKIALDATIRDIRGISQEIRQVNESLASKVDKLKEDEV